MKYIKLSGFLSIVLFCSNALQNYPIEGNNFCQLKIKIEKLNKQFKVEDFKELSLIVQNLSPNPISLPENLNIGEQFGDFETDLVFDIKKKDPKSGKYGIMDFYLEFSRTPGIREEKRIAPYEEIRLIQSLYLIKPLNNTGKYKIRARVKLLNSKCNFEIRSNWVKLIIVD